MQFGNKSHLTHWKVYSRECLIFLSGCRPHSIPAPSGFQIRLGSWMFFSGIRFLFLSVIPAFQRWLGPPTDWSGRVLRQEPLPGFPGSPPARSMKNNILPIKNMLPLRLYFSAIHGCRKPE